MYRATITAVPSLVVPAHVTLFSLSDCLLERNKMTNDDEMKKCLRRAKHEQTPQTCTSLPVVNAGNQQQRCVFYPMSKKVTTVHV